MLEGMKVKLTYVGHRWSEWFEVGDNVIVKQTYSDGFSMQAVKGCGVFGGWISKDPQDCLASLVGPASSAEREMIKMLHPGIEEYLCLG